MARIAGVNIPTNKRVEIALRYIHGIGPKSTPRRSAQKVGIAGRAPRQPADRRRSHSDPRSRSTATTWSKAISAAKWR